MIIPRSFRVLLCAVVICLSLPAFAQQGNTVSAISSDGDWEREFKGLISSDRIRSYMEHLTARPHHVGSPYDKENAEWILARFKEWGWDAHIETFSVLFPTPKERVVEMVGPTQFIAKLQEPPIPVDPTSNQTAEQLPTYNAYSIDGDVTAPLVYVNYGTNDDYRDLQRMGVSAKGAIVIVRYGRLWRGAKVKIAAEQGAVACLLYSDPKDDGYFQGETYPKGGYSPKDGVQRGSVLDTYYMGDPLTPGVGATPDAKRLTLTEAQTLTKIPVLPLSYSDAQPLLTALGGPVAPEGWRGALPITYHVGSGPAKVHMRVTANWGLKTIYDVIAKIPGSTYPNEWILRGNHHDAWVNGADDPGSGTSVLLEEARGLGEAHKRGWQPKRTILYCAWDAEEPGQLGSTEWVETHLPELQEKAVAYINTDATERGYFASLGSHSLERFVGDVARDFVDPEKKISLWERARRKAIAGANSAQERAEIREHFSFRFETPSYDTDYVAFLDHAGIASVVVGFFGEESGSVYHSIYDDFYWYTHFADTNFAYGQVLAQVAGTAVMRIADADVLPFDFEASAYTIGGYVKDLKSLLKDKQNEVRERNRELDEDVFTAASDPKKPFVAPLREPVPPFMNFAVLDNAVDSLTRSAQRYSKALAKWKARNATADNAAFLANVNRRLIYTERAFLTDTGLPGRPWFKHQIYAPGRYYNFDPTPLAAVRDFMDGGNWKAANEQIPGLAEVLEKEAAAIDAAVTELEKAIPADPASGTP